MRDKMANQKKQLIIGPFAQAAQNIDEISTNIYMSYLYEQTVNELLKAEEELSAATLIEPSGSEDTESLKNLKEKVYFLESVVSLATKNYSINLEELENAEVEH